MQLENIQALLADEVMSNVNLSIVVALLAIGFCIKHFSFLDNIKNGLIPPILCIVGVVLAFMMNGFTVGVFISGIVSAAISIGLHQMGKNVFCSDKVVVADIDKTTEVDDEDE